MTELSKDSLNNLVSSSERARAASFYSGILDQMPPRGWSAKGCRMY